jgi:hypothetical protein
MTLHHRTNRFAAIASAALLGVALAAQSPPPTGGVSVVGLTNQMQTAGPFGEQRIGAICAPQFYRSAAPLGAGGVGLGGSIAWWSEAINPTAVPLTLHAAGTALTFFAVSPFAFSSLQLPFAAPGHDLLFVPTTAFVVAAPWTFVMTTGGGGAIIPPGGYDRWYLTLDVPLNPSLVGSVWAAQALRIDPTDLLIYLSNEYLVQIWS